MQLLIVATVSRFTSLWPLWQRRSRDEGRQLTGAPGLCCHQVHLLNLTQRQEDGRKKKRYRSKEREHMWGRKRGVATKYEGEKV